MDPAVNDPSPAQRRVDRLLAALRGWSRGRKAAAGGAALAVLLALAMVALPGSPAQQVRELEVSGQELYEAILERHPDLRAGNRIAQDPERGTGTNRVVLPDAVWDGLSVDQRNSLGTWLNALGGAWEIRVGALADDGRRVRDAGAVITSEAWNQQLK